ncbi:MAG: hypothetical protein QOH74_1226 [Gaiellales bacterium]|nr:hypothetical protein [Gaiellales bacterium]
MESDYRSGDDFVVEFLDYRYGFSRTDFTQRVVAAAIRLELVSQRDLSDGECADLVDLASTGRMRNPISQLGRHLAAHAEAIDGLHPEPLAYWLRKLVFRGAWLDHRVKAGLLDLAFDESSGSFAYRMPSDQAPLLELAPVPSWAQLRFTA